MALPQLSTKKAGSRTWINGKISNAFCSFSGKTLPKKGLNVAKAAARHLCYQPLIYRLLFKREFDIKSKDSKLPVIDKVHFNGGFLFKETIGCDSR